MKDHESELKGLCISPLCHILKKKDNSSKFYLILLKMFGVLGIWACGAVIMIWKKC